MRRKFQFFLLALMFMVTQLPISAGAQVTDQYVLHASAARVEVGDRVSIAVKGEALTDLYAAEMQIMYDEQLLEYTGYTSFLDNQAYVHEPKVQGNTIRLVFTLTGNKPGITGDKDLFTFTFRTKKVGTASVSLNALMPIDSALNKTNGSIGSGTTIAVVNSNSGSPGSGSGSQPSGNPSSPSHSGTSVLHFDASPDARGAISIQAGANDLLDAGKHSTDETVTVRIKSGAEVKKIQLNLPAKQVQQLSSDSGKIKTLSVESDLAAVTISRDMLDNRTLSETSNLQLLIEKVDKQPLYDVNLLLDGSPITSFAPKSIQVNIPYALGLNEKPYQVVIHTITEDGKVKIVRNGQFDASTGTVQFQPDQLGRYKVSHAQVDFRDMTGYDWANEAVFGLAAREVINGRSEGYFIPGGDVTRAEFVKMLMGLIDAEDSSATATFTDVLLDDWSYRSIASAQKLGLVQGKDDGSFGSKDEISREDMAVFMYRALNARKSGTAHSTLTPAKFLDQDQVSSYARDAVAAVQQAGLIEGVSEGYFDPKGKLTRAQAAAVIYRFYQALR
ncbi:S-layer homology domain-containing protein [Paenibacillus whitsoniae]|uniref:SLH domain-containing protein n=1 Tax=Paenibacillus whitsoniae TaxID=2496558 RepID=A0A3S0A681_9BACL|nr:S-layer homology domain-containing protein [Paenibacillus whitsoniae]RTE10517.1 hypothetical protein EJQ19_06575 [Paenibacillus whitsoniae]